MNYYKRVLTIAGSDSGGGAGIQADIKTISALGCYATSAITAVTAQNTLKVFAVDPVSPKMVEAQIKTVLDDIGADAIKIGMLANGNLARVVASTLKCYPEIPIVLDPVLVATSGDSLSGNEVVKVLIDQLIPMATIVTPNMPETFALSGVLIESEDDYIKAWNVFEKLDAKALLIKGGHNPMDGMVLDQLFTADKTRIYSSEFIESPNTHGTGCTLSSAIASFLAHGNDLYLAVEHATAYIHHALATAADYRLGHGHGPVHHFHKIWQ